ncbi:MAG: ATP-binding protein, partial [Pelovirga sp.]
GQQGMKLALLLNAVDPSIGGVLIRGHKGTAKSTAARALAALLPPLSVVADCPYHCPPDQPEQMHRECLEQYQQNRHLSRAVIATPVVELPLGATEDRVVGTLHLEKTLRHGERHFEPGLLAAANRGILYVDEVNLLEDHLVDLLLDAAASGVNRVEREGMCVSHPARFMLIGTMNPEEGELRPQFLDRFGLCVTVSGLNDPVERQELLRRRLGYEQDPVAFAADWSKQEAFLAEQVKKARQRLPDVVIPAEIYAQVAELSLSLKVQGHRADIVLLKAARAHAALCQRQQLDRQDLREVAWLALPHRLAGPSYPDTRQLDDALLPFFNDQDKNVLESGPALDPEAVDDLDCLQSDYEFPGAAAAGSMLFETFKKKARNTTSS